MLYFKLVVILKQLKELLKLNSMEEHFLNHGRIL